jgi:hypothetical protein
MAALAAIVMALVAAAPVQAAEPGGISGRITSNGATVDLGMVDVYDWYTLDYVTTGYADVTGKYEITGLEPGVYEVALGNGDGLMWYDYFPELYNDVPYHLDYRAEPVEVTGGGVTGGIDADLQPMFGDMFDTPFTEDISRAAAVATSTARTRPSPATRWPRSWCGPSGMPTEGTPASPT